MKKLLIYCSFLFLGSCVSTKQIGSVNMVSNRNVDSNGNYVLIKSYMGAPNKEIKNSKAKSVEAAIDQVVKSTPGGEFLKNVKIYWVDSKYIAVEGDVWGIADNANFRGFAVGNKVKWTKLFKDYTGEIMDLKNDKSCTIKRDADGSSVEVDYKDLTKIGNK